MKVNRHFAKFNKCMLRLYTHSYFKFDNRMCYYLHLMVLVPILIFAITTNIRTRDVKWNVLPITPSMFATALTSICQVS